MVGWKEVVVVVGWKEVVVVVGWKEVVVAVGGEIGSLTVDISRLRMVETLSPSGVNKSTDPPN